MENRYVSLTDGGSGAGPFCRRAALRLFVSSLFLAVPAFIAATTGASMYTWQDDTGGTCYVDDLSKVPVKFRKSAHKVEEDVVEPPTPAADKTVPAEPKAEAPSPPQPRRIEGKTYIGNSGEFSYYFDRTMVVVSGQGSTRQYSLGILEVNEKTGEQKGGALHLWCERGRADEESVRLPDEYIQSLLGKFCSLPEGGGAPQQDGSATAPAGQER